MVAFGGTGGGKVELTVRAVTAGQVSLLGTTMGSPRDFAGAAGRRRRRRLGAGDRLGPAARRGGGRAPARGGRGALRQAGPVDRLTAPVAALALRAARRAVARAAAEGGGPPELSLDRIAAWLEDDPDARAALDAAAAERTRRDVTVGPAGAGAGPAAARRARADEVHHAVHALRLMGELAADEPGRLVLPGFGPSTWRAIAVLRDGGTEPEEAWAAAVADLPLQDLGDEAPPGLARPADPRLGEGALRLLAVDAQRQDVRNALVTAEASRATAAERGNQAGVRMLDEEVGALERALEAADVAVAAMWDQGVRAAAQG